MNSKRAERMLSSIEQYARERGIFTRTIGKLGLTVRHYPITGQFLYEYNGEPIIRVEALVLSERAT